MVNYPKPNLNIISTDYTFLYFILCLEDQQTADTQSGKHNVHLLL